MKAMWHCCFGGLKLVTVDSIIFGFILTHGCSVEEEDVSICRSLPHCLNIHQTSQSGLIFSHCNLGLGSKPILSWIAAVSGFTYTGATWNHLCFSQNIIDSNTSTIGDEPKRLCLAVARLASISAFSWLYLFFYRLGEGLKQHWWQKRILLWYILDSQFNPGWSSPNHIDCLVSILQSPSRLDLSSSKSHNWLSVLSLHFFSTPSTIGTDILSIKSSIWAFSCSSTSGEMNKWVSSRSWKTIQIQVHCNMS